MRTMKKGLANLLKNLRDMPGVNPEEDFKKRAKVTLLELLIKAAPLPYWKEQLTLTFLKRRVKDNLSKQNDVNKAGQDNQVGTSNKEEYASEKDKSPGKHKQL